MHPEHKRRRVAEGPKPTPIIPIPEAAPEPGKDESNVGNQLLAKMGWKTGTGLGAEGSGRVEPIKVQQFAERAGLGASQGHAAGSWTGMGGRQQQAHDVVSLVTGLTVSDVRRGKERQSLTVWESGNGLANIQSLRLGTEPWAIPSRKD